MSKVDYSKLVEALKEGDEEKANELFSEIIDRLEDYLQVVMGADPQSASECAQQSILAVYEQIQKDNIKDEQYIFSYLLKTCKHEYYRYKKHQHRFEYEEGTVSEMVVPPQQMENLLDEERYKILKLCLKELDKKSRLFIIDYFANPDMSTKEASRHFEMTAANVRTRKSRITARLHECYDRRSAR